MGNEEQKQLFDEMATEFLNFIENPLERFESKEAEYAYRLQRTRTFLEMKFGHVEGLQKEVEALRQWKKIMMPAVVRDSERRTPQKHPLDFSEEG